MPHPPLPDHVRELLTKPNPCVIATVREDGQPVSVATWYLLDDDRILVNMDEGRRRLEHLRGDKRVALTVLDRDGWQTHVSMVGRVVELYDDDGFADIDRISKHYIGSRFHNRDRRRVSARIEIERWHGWGAVTRQ